MTIQFVSSRGEETCDPTFAQEVKERSGANFARCYQCLTCSSGCPFAFAMDFTPNQIIRMVQLGLKERVLNSSTIWLCASCETCVARCPNEIDIVGVMDTLREISLKDERIRGKNIPKFHDIFLRCIQSSGKVHELSLIMRYMLTSGDMFKVRKLSGDMVLGLNMFRRGKLALRPSKIKRLEEVKQIFERSK